MTCLSPSFPSLHAPLFLTGLLFALSGCPGSTSSDGSTGGETGAPGCECFSQAMGSPLWTCAPGIECGDYVDLEVDTGPCGGGDSTGTGGEPDECAQDEANNELVVECVLAAAATGDPMHFRRLVHPGAVSSDSDDYWVRPGEPLGVRREEFRDLCIDVWTELRTDPNFDDCMGLEPPAAWGCIYQQLSTEPIAACGMAEGCEGI